MSDFFLDEEALTRHCLVVGATGSGKTNFLHLMMKQQLLRGGGVLVLDSKDSRNDLQEFLALANQHNRWHDVRLLHVGNPDISSSYNPLLRGDADEISARLLGLLQDGEASGELVRGVRVFVGILKAMRLPFNMADVAALLGGGSAVAWVLENAPNSTQEFQDFRQFIKGYMVENGVEEVLDEQKLQGVFGDLAGRLFSFSSGSVGNIFNTYTPDIDLVEMLQSNRLVYAVLPTLSKRGLATDAAKLLLSDLQGAVGQLQNENTKPAPPFMVLLEGFANYAAPGVGDLFEHARSANVGLVAFVESFASVADVGGEVLSKVLANSWHKLAFTVQDPESCAQLALQAAQAAPNLGRYYQAEQFRALKTGEAVLVGPDFVSSLQIPLMEFDVPEFDVLDLPRFQVAARRGLALAEKFRSVKQG
jgi:energy-coupling factor transporter ATP-binding protein EcfA2